MKTDGFSCLAYALAMSLKTYTDFMQWLDAIEGLNLIHQPVQMQFELAEEALARAAFSVDQALTWIEAHAIGAVHHLAPEDITAEGHLFEFEDVIDADAFKQAWGRFDKLRKEAVILRRA